MKNRPVVAEAFGTALLVFFGCGTATPTFGFGATVGEEEAPVAPAPEEQT